jgi:hypothetical protein
LTRATSNSSISASIRVFLRFATATIASPAAMVSPAWTWRVMTTPSIGAVMTVFSTSAERRATSAAAEARRARAASRSRSAFSHACFEPTAIYVSTGYIKGFSLKDIIRFEVDDSAFRVHRHYHRGDLRTRVSQIPNWGRLFWNRQRRRHALKVLRGETSEILTSVDRRSTTKTTRGWGVD